MKAGIGIGTLRAANTLHHVHLQRPKCSPLTHLNDRPSRQRVPAALPEFSAVIQDIAQSATLANPGLLTGVALTTVVFTGGYKVLRKGLTPLGVANAWILGASIFSAFGVGGFLLVCLYFLFGTLVTKVKLEQKQKEGIAEARSGQRGPVSGSSSRAALA